MHYMTLNNMFSLIISIAAMSIPTTLMADDTDKIADKIIVSHSVHENFRQTVYGNPAAHFFKNDYSLTSIYFMGVKDNSSGQKIAQMGCGNSFWGLNATSQYIIDNNNHVWGEASYNKGTREKVIWNETSDFALLYPYVMADGKGGDLDYEQYFFNGGYAGRYRNIVYGAELQYRALDEYRTRDPRPNNIVADLNAEAGFGVVIGNHSVCLGLYAGKYKQTNGLKYFNDLGASKEYHLTGLGNEFVRFSGASNNVFYKGSNIGTGIELVPVKAEGLSVSFNYNRFSFEKILSDLNKLALNELTENKFSGEIAWTEKHGSSTYYGIKADGTYSERKGHDNLFGDAVSNAYPKIGSTLMYRSKVMFGRISGFYESTIGRHFPFGILPYVSYGSFESKHTESLNKFKSDSFILGTLLQGSYRSGRNLLRLSFNTAYRISNDSELSISDYGSCSEDLTDNLTHTAGYFAKNELNTRIALRYQLQFTKKYFSCYLETAWQYRSYLEDYSDNVITLTAGINL